MTNKNSTKLLFKTYRQPITVINLTGVNFNHGKDCLRATEIRKGHIIDLMLCNKVTCLLMKNHGTSLFFSYIHIISYVMP